MSGHNKWSKIKHKKEASDTKKAKVFSKFAKLIELAAQKGSNPQTNYNLRSVIDEAKTFNMPTTNIERAIKKGSGQDRDNEKLKEIWYEAYGPKGVAILIKTITDNKNRTVADIKHILSKNSSHLADTGSVRWQFGEKGAARFPITLLGKDQSALDNLLNNLEQNGDVQEVFTNNQ